MARKNNTEMDKDLHDLEPDEMIESAFKNQDEFKPKIYTKHRAFGKRRSVLCYRNPGFDTSLDAIDECDSSGLEGVNLDFSGSYDDPGNSSRREDDLEEALPSSQHRRIEKMGSLRQRRTERNRNAAGINNYSNSSGTLPSPNSSTKNLGKWKQIRYGISLKWDHFKHGIKDFFKDIDIWKSNLKAVEGKFGSGVLSYFLFLRWLFFLDLVITIGILAFVVAPQLMHRPSYKHNNQTFTGLELLTGEGWFLPTEMYYGTYGGYKNDTIILSFNTPYNLPLAYLTVAGGYVLLCVIILVRSMAISYNKNYISGKDFRDSFFTKIFCSWDYAVTQENSASLQSKNIYIDIKELLTEKRDKKKKRTFDESCNILMLRLVAHVIAIAMMGAACYTIYWVKIKGADRIKNAIPENKYTKVFISLIPAISITMLNILLPFIFRIIASLEKYESPRITIEVSLYRTVILKLSTLCVYIWLIYRSIEKQTSSTQYTSNSTLTVLTPVCWETKVGVEFYQLAIVDFVFLLLETFFGEMFRHAFVSCMNNALGLELDHPGFDISRNVLGLIYSQGLCWLGAFFCPMLPLITIIKFFILFYYKKASVLRFCRASVRPFKASKMQLRFFFLLSFMLALAMIVIGLITINEERLKPSTFCGPFRGKDSIFAMIKVVIDRDFGSELRDITKSVASSIVMVMIFFILGMIIYYQRLRKSSAEKKIKLLKEQICLAGQDKMFLLKEIRNILKQRVQATRHIST